MNNCCQKLLLLSLVFLSLVAHTCFAAAEPKKPLVLLISLDGFKPNYLERGLTPTLNKLAQQGAVSKGLISSFPSVTFPNHYTLVTGLVPDKHGIVNNTMRDPQLPDQLFELSNRQAVQNPIWWEDATPIWVTAKRQGKHTATLFWPGSEAAIHGISPDLWLPYSNLASSQRVKKLLSWLDTTEDKRADFATLYFSEIDSLGHKKGPNSHGLNTALTRVDAALEQLLIGLDKLALKDRTSFVIVSDHGMAEVPEHNVIDMSSLLQHFPSASIIWGGAFVGIEPNQEDETGLLSALNTNKQLSCWNKHKIPKRFKYGSHRRVPTVLCLAQQGWFATDKQGLKTAPVVGMHGYDPNLPDMHGLFIASGYRIKRQAQPLPVFTNVDIYPLLTGLLKIKAEPNDGDPHLLSLID